MGVCVCLRVCVRGEHLCVYTVRLSALFHLQTGRPYSDIKQLKDTSHYSLHNVFVHMYCMYACLLEFFFHTLLTSCYINNRINDQCRVRIRKLLGLNELTLSLFLSAF